MTKPILQHYLNLLFKKVRTSSTTSEASTPTTEGTSTGSGDSNNNNRTNGDNNDHNNNHRNDNRRNTIRSNEHKLLDDKVDIGDVLGLRTKYLEKKQSFRSFMEKRWNTFQESSSIQQMSYLFLQNNCIHMLHFKIPNTLSAEEDKNSVLVALKNQRIKLHVNRDMQLNDNMIKLYRLVKGQCSHSLEAMLKQQAN